MMWLRDEDRPIVRNFAILDDITYGMSMFGWHFFKCEYDRGLTQEIAANVAEFLSKPAIDMYNYGNKTKKETA